MRVFLFALLLVCFGEHAFASTEETFASWASAHGRKYRSESERALRLAAFSTNMVRMVELQKLSPHAQYAPDEFFDWTDEEKKGLTGLNVTKKHAATVGRGPDINPLVFSDATIRKAIAAGDLDWVAKGAVTRPTSQGRCATCQDFSAAADIEGAWYIDALLAFTRIHSLIFVAFFLRQGSHQATHSPKSLNRK
jgi:hypothetical protein